jgi:hypothetical protein
MRMENLNKCIICGSRMNKVEDSIFHYTDCGLPEVYLKGIVTHRCTNKDCGEEEISIPNIEDLHQLLVEKIASSTISKHFFKFDRSHWAVDKEALLRQSE